jgi:hypothetical protein
MSINKKRKDIKGKMLIDSRMRQTFVHDTPQNLGRIKDFYNTLPPCPKHHFDILKWTADVRKKMTTELIPYIDYNPDCAKMPLNFNLIMLLGFQSPYSEINLKLKDLKYDPDLNLETNEYSKCCCGHHIKCLFFIKAPYFSIPCGCDCIETHTLILEKDIKQVRKRAEEKQYADQIMVDMYRKKIVKTLDDKFEKEAIEREQKYRKENKLCLVCGTKCDWPKCWKCVKKCGCGKTIQPQYEKYDTCKQCAKEEFLKKSLKS